MKKISAKKPYISGPIAGASEVALEEKLDRFTRAELALRRQGYEPVNELRIQACPTGNCNGDRLKPDGSYLHSWQCRLRYDLIAMLNSADSIAMLPGWRESPGATLLHDVATRLEWEVIDLSQDPIVLGLPIQIENDRHRRRRADSPS